MEAKTDAPSLVARQKILCVCLCSSCIYLLMDKQYLNDLHKLAVNFEGLAFASTNENAKNIQPFVNYPV